jgi:hypothetical protein
MVGAGGCVVRGTVPGMYHLCTTPGDLVRNSQIVFAFTSFERAIKAGTSIAVEDRSSDEKALPQSAARLRMK